MESSLGHKFSDPRLLVAALTHKSYLQPPVANVEDARGDVLSEVGEMASERSSYERLEFLGDRVLGLLAGEALVERHVSIEEGELSRLLTRLVRGEVCARVGRSIGLASSIRLGPSLARRRHALPPSILEDVCEALLGALYLDGGLEAARRFFYQQWNDELRAARSGRDGKTRLQEWAQTKGYALPTYTLEKREGPAHEPHFVVIAALDGSKMRARGEGRRRKEAEQAAATALLARLEEENHA